MKKVMIAMSGGVDSSVAAYMLQKQGYECIGATMLLHEGPSDAAEAQKVAAKLGIPHYVFDFREAFDQYVVRPFVRAYEEGRTPNPCVICNRHLKFEALHAKAAEMGCDYIASGHYARVGKEEGGDRYVLRKSAVPEKDQSYVLAMLTQEQLAKTLFPLEGMSKDEVRRIAAGIGFENASKPDSQDICFIPDGDYAHFIESYEGKTYPEGDFIDEEGNFMGKHQGIIRYTVGQRKGLGIAAGKPVYVSKIDPASNTVTLTDNDALFTDCLTSADFNWISIPKPDEPLRAKARIRYQHKEQPATVTAGQDGGVTIRFDEPQRAITPGQTVVVYDGDIVIGGGTID